MVNICYLCTVMSDKSNLTYRLFEHVFGENREMLERLAYFYVGSREDAEDIVSQSFLNLWEKREDILEDRILPYLFTTVKNACLDYRRVIDIPGYEKIHLHDAARFIGTMNYGYAGTRELNEALVSRFMVIDMPEVDTETLERILMHLFPEIRKEGMKQVTGFFADLQIKAANHEISSRPLDLRGLVGALRTVRGGLSPYAALKMGIVNKTFDLFEREVTEDVLMTRIPPEWGSEELFA